jgi:hypothetical protein
MALTKVHSRMIAGSSINVIDYGAVSDGNITDASIGTDNTSAFNAALTDAAVSGSDVFVPAGIYRVSGSLVIKDKTGLIGEGWDSSIIVSGATTTGTMGDQSSLRRLHFYSNGTSGFRVQGDTEVIISEVYFEGLGGNNWIQCIWMWDGDTIIIDKCYFKNTGYSIINQSGYSFNNILIRDCIAENQYLDFIELNSATVAMKNVTIIGCHFLGNVGFDPTSKGSNTELRFVGATEVNNLTITNCIVEECWGDSAIHLEDVEEHVIISNNIFRRCNTIYGYIQNIAPSKEVNISANIFDHDTVTSTDKFIDVSTTGSEGRLNIVGNKFFGATYVSAVSISTGDNNVVSSNSFKSCTTAIVCSGGSTQIITNNDIFGYSGANGIIAGGRYVATNAIGVRNGLIANNSVLNFGPTDNCITIGAGSTMAVGQKSTDTIVSGNLFDGYMDLGWSNNTQVFGNICKFGSGGSYRNSLNDWSGGARDQNSCQYANLQANGTFLTATFYGSTAAPF